MFSEAKADRAVNFFEKILVHTKGPYSGKPFILTDWQKHGIIRPLFGTLRDDGLRQYRTAYISMGRKNGKSELAAGGALYLLVADDEEGAEIYGAAADRDQASIVFNVASQMVKRSPYLSNLLSPIDSRKRIVYNKTASIYEAIPADERTAHGLNAHGIIFDELHVQAKRNLWDTLTTSTGSRLQPLVMAVTTAGYDRQSICYEQYDYAKRVARGAVNDPTFFSFICELDKDDDWTDEALWPKANPALGDFRQLDEMRAQAAKAQEIPSLQNTFRRLYGNQWTQQDVRWLSLDKWDACNGAVDPEALVGRRCYAGLDLASTTDLAALVLVFPDDEGGFDILPHFWIPGENIQERVRRDRVAYDVWADRGYLTATEGDVIDYDSITAKIDELAQKYDIVEIGFDRWGATQLTNNLSNSGMTVIAIGQGFASMNAPTKETLNLVISGKLRHGGNPVLRWMADNVVVKTDPADNQKPDKQKSTDRIDGIVALIMAIDRATRNAEGNVYEERGLISV